jgi:hypothetical protein
MRMKLSGKFMSLLMAGAVLVAAVPLVSAYEAHMFNVKVHVEERFNCEKVVEAATEDDVAYLVENGIIPEEWDPEPGDPYVVPAYTCVVWLVTVHFTNPNDYPITNVVVTDRWGAELGGVPLDEESPVNLFIKTHSRGKANKESFETQYRITWYVTYQSGNVAFPEEVDNSGVVGPGEEEYLQLYVWTKLNPSGRQEYTTPGTYTLNSGPTAKWFDLEGHQFSFEGESWYIEAVD